MFPVSSRDSLLFYSILSVTQHVQVVEEKGKTLALIDLLGKLPDDSKTLIFASKKVTCDWLSKFLVRFLVRCRRVLCRV